LLGVATNGCCEKQFYHTAMVKRYIVRAALNQHAEGNDSWIRWRTVIIWIIIPVLLSIGYGYGITSQRQLDQLIPEISSWPRFILLALGIITLLSATFSWTSSRATNKEQGVAVFIYPLGIQLATVVYDVDQQQQHLVSGPQSFLDVKPGPFFPRDQIIDCIVNEVILAHKVISVVVFRVRQRTESRTIGVSHTHTHAFIKLVHAFPGADMTYVECLAIRHEIMKELKS
jgi:hypothetical protein